MPAMVVMPWRSKREMIICAPVSLISVAPL
jgi:hypothetical protein